MREIAPRPDLTPYVTFSKGFRDKGNVTEFIRTNGTDTWVSYVMYMYDNTGNYMGAFHTNGGRAFYKVPGRNGGNWCEIMDNHDMQTRDANIQHAHNRITDTWNRAQGAHNILDNDTVRDIRLAGYIAPVVAYRNDGQERGGYIVTGLINGNGDGVIDHVQMRALQIKRGGAAGQNWYNVIFT